MKKKRTVRKQFFKLMFALCATFALSIPIGVRAENEVKEKTDANIKGTVVDSKTQQPLSHASVLVVGTVITTTTDADGHYSLKNLPVGKVKIEVRSAGYRTLRQEVTTERNYTTETNFELTPDEIALDEVVVSANRSLTLRRESPVIVNVLDTKLFESTHSTTLAQGLNFQPGVRTEDNCTNCGFSQVRINGLDGHYSQILVDSRPVFTALQGVYGLEQIPANMVERVEIVRGGGSALFGASAIGGTINIITKEPSENSAELAHTITGATNGSTSFDNNTTGNVSVVTTNGRAGFYLYAQSRHRSAYDRDGDGYTDLPTLDNKTLGLSTFLRLTDYSKVTLKYHGLKEFRRGGNNLFLPPHEANIAEQIEHTINGGSLAYDLFNPNGKGHFSAYASFQNVDRKSYYGGLGELASAAEGQKAMNEAYKLGLSLDMSEEDAAKLPNDQQKILANAQAFDKAQRAYNVTHNINYIAGAQYVHNFDRLLFMPADLTMGAEYSFDRIKDRSLGYNSLLEQRVRISSAFVQNEWKNAHWGLLLGGRLDKHNLISHLIFSPRVNLRYNPTPNTNLRLTYAGGFRAPQAFDEDLHTKISDGDRVKIALAKDLKEERSHSFSASADLYKSFGTVQTNLLIEGFYTRLNNMFATRKLADDVVIDGARVEERYNSNGATVFGLNLEGKASLTSWAQLQAGFTWQNSRYRTAEEWDDDAADEFKTTKRLLRTPDSYGYFTLNVRPTIDFNVSLSGVYTGRMYVGHPKGGSERTKDFSIIEHTPSFLTLNLKLAYDFYLYNQVKLQASAGVQNLLDAYQKDLDKGPSRASDYVYGPTQPRSIFLGVKISY
ncbi:MAG: TonB-dependent receptor domain-containing protein [Prevotella conceptionensis]